MDNAKVSVIVPVYNVEQYLGKCLDSLVNQTLEEIEILVVNDGSPDNSQAIIDDFAMRYPEKIRVFVKENGGLSDARNYGVERAQGEYIGFVDSDDYVDLDMYESMYKKAIELDAEVVCCPLTNEYAKKTVKNYYKEDIFGVNAKDNPKLLTLANSIAPNKIFNRKFWQKNSFTFPVGQWFEDSYLIYNVMLSANRVGCVNIPFMHYVRDREGSITNSFDMRLFDILKSAASIVDHAKTCGAFEATKEELEYICLRHMTARLENLRKCPNSAEARRFVSEMVDFLDMHFPRWRQNRFLKYSKKTALRNKMKKIMMRSKTLMLIYVSNPVWLIKMANGIIKVIKNLRKIRIPESDKKKKQKSENAKEEKRLYLQKNGMEVLNEVQSMLKEIGITSFADFGTCLGLVREGKMLAHDLDMDIGVIADPKDREMIRITLERHGYKLWRQYSYKGNPVEESYRYRGVKVDLNFYELTGDYARTWLFYTKPGYTYENSYTRHVVQMTYSPINGVKYEEFGGYYIALPENPELLLAEKYGPNWRIPDTGWIYWESPAAVKLEEIGSFRTFKYVGWSHASFDTNGMTTSVENE